MRHWHRTSLRQDDKKVFYLKLDHKNRSKKVEKPGILEAKAKELGYAIVDFDTTTAFL